MELNISVYTDDPAADMTDYEHTQRGRMHQIFFGIVAVLLIGSWLARGEPGVAALNLLIAATLLFVAFMFGSLTVRDDGAWLVLRYGPLPVFRKRIRYAEITAVEADRTRWIDGWGIHYIPGRGWTYNLWGFDCVKLTLGKKIIRVGTDDVENLVEFLRQKVQSRTSADE